MLWATPSQAAPESAEADSDPRGTCTGRDPRGKGTLAAVVGWPPAVWTNEALPVALAAVLADPAAPPALVRTAARTLYERAWMAQSEVPVDSRTVAPALAASVARLRDTEEDLDTAENIVFALFHTHPPAKDATRAVTRAVRGKWWGLLDDDVEWLLNAAGK